MTDNGKSTIGAGPAVQLSVPRTAAALPKVRLGEELPIFCERCGYSLNGLAQIRCERCQVLHFSCPECDHHQPINTLRPAAQRIIGRLRAWGLGLIVFLKIIIFFWVLFGWGAAGMEFSFYRGFYGRAGRSSFMPIGFDWEVGVPLVLFGIAFGMVARMLLLRWSRGVLVGLAVGALVVLAMAIGAELRRMDLNYTVPSPFQIGFILCMLSGFIGAWVGCSIVWGIWLALVTAFLPKRAATALLEWQRAMSLPKGEKDRSDATTSVTA